MYKSQIWREKKQENNSVNQTKKRLSRKPHICLLTYFHSLKFKIFSVGSFFVWLSLCVVLVAKEKKTTTCCGWILPRKKSFKCSFRNEKRHVSFNGPLFYLQYIWWKESDKLELVIFLIKFFHWLLYYILHALWTCNSANFNMELDMSKSIYSTNVLWQSGVFHIALTSHNCFISEKN